MDCSSKNVLNCQLCSTTGSVQLSRDCLALQHCSSGLVFGTISAPLTGNFRQRVRSPPVVTFSGAGTTTTVMIRVMMLRMSNHMQLANICSCNNFWSRNNNCSPVAFESQTGTLMSTPLSRQLPPAPTFDVFLHLRSEQW